MTDTTEDLSCSVCLRVFYEPRVIGRCGHTFCLGCIQGVSTCPLCRKGFSLSDLCRNFVVDTMVQTRAKDQWEKRKAEEEKKPPALDAFGMYSKYMRKHGFQDVYTRDNWKFLTVPEQVAYWEKAAREENARVSWENYVREEEKKAPVVDLTGDNPDPPRVLPYMEFARSMRHEGRSYGEILESWEMTKRNPKRYAFWCKKAREENARRGSITH